ncbi:MAG: tetratricopeptide repeat protein [Candidatus Omnitrophota bacterium]
MAWAVFNLLDIMAFELKKFIRCLCFCLVALVFINTKALALDKNTSIALSHYIMGVMYEDLGDIDTAIEEFSKSLKEDHENLLVRLHLASNFIRKNDTHKAIEELKLAVSLDPEAIEPHTILALLYFSQNKLDLATSEYETALKGASKLQPKNIDIYKSLGQIYLEQKKFKEAEQVYKTIIDLSDNDAQAHFYLGSIYNELKNRGLTEKELRRALKLKPDYDEALNFLGYLYVEENRNLAQAEVMIKKALTIDPGSGAYIDSLGWLYFKKGRFKEALKELEKASSLLEDPVIYDHLGDAQVKAGEIEKAKQSWQKSLKLDPGQKDVKEKLDKLNK